MKVKNRSHIQTSQVAEDKASASGLITFLLWITDSLFGLIFSKDHVMIKLVLLSIGVFYYTVYAPSQYLVEDIPNFLELLDRQDTEVLLPKIEAGAFPMPEEDLLLQQYKKEIEEGPTQERYQEIIKHLEELCFLGKNENACILILYIITDGSTIYSIAKILECIKNIDFIKIDMLLPVLLWEDLDKAFQNYLRTSNERLEELELSPQEIEKQIVEIIHKIGMLLRFEVARMKILNEINTKNIEKIEEFIKYLEALDPAYSVLRKDKILLKLYQKLSEVKSIKLLIYRANTLYDLIVHPDTNLEMRYTHKERRDNVIDDLEEISDGISEGFKEWLWEEKFKTNPNHN